MHVLDLGSGLGHVSQLVASLVSPEGSVVGVEAVAELLEAAERRRADAGLDRVSFVQGDVRAFDAGRTFDAVVGRLILSISPIRWLSCATISGRFALGALSRWSTSTSALPVSSLGCRRPT